MAWQTPKTNWQENNALTPTDFNRIEGNIQHLQDTKETPAGAQAKANTAEANAKAYTDAHEQKTAPHSGHETPAGAQAKAAAAAGAVQAELNAHKADGAAHSKTARFVVGTSTAGWTAADCDYLCDGTADQTEINAAITALPATGGEVVILDGTYNITAKINVTKNNVSIRGNGNATILRRMFNSAYYDEGVITLKGRSNCKIANLQVDGNGASYTDSINNGIYLRNSSNNTITGIACNNNRGRGIYLESSSNNTITGNTCNNNSGNNGIYLSSSSNNNTITGNACNNNGIGIYLESSSNNTVTSNTYNNNNYGIYIRSASNNTVTSNTCNNNGTGIYLLDSSNNTITGNTYIRGTGQTSDYASDQYTIRLHGTANNYNLISSNNCMGKAVVFGGGTGNSAWGNKYDSGDDLPI